jgi:plastocyanin
MRNAGGGGLIRGSGTTRSLLSCRLSLLVLLLLLGAAGCLREPPPPTDPELAEALGLPAGTPIHRVTLSGRGEDTRVLPTLLRVRPGDLVQFVTVDRRVYAVRFDLDALAPEPLGFLRATGQEGSPPLATEGARFVVSLEGAPEGAYPFRVEGYGLGVDGMILVESPP